MFVYIVLGGSISSEAQTFGFWYIFDSPGLSNLVLWKRKTVRCTVRVVFTLFSFAPTSSGAKKRWISVYLWFTLIFKICYMTKNVLKHACLFSQFSFVRLVRRHKQCFGVCLIRLGFQHLLYDHFVLKRTCVSACARLFVQFGDNTTCHWCAFEWPEFSRFVYDEKVFFNITCVCSFLVVGQNNVILGCFRISRVPNTCFLKNNWNMNVLGEIRLV